MFLCVCVCVCVCVCSLTFQRVCDFFVQLTDQQEHTNTDSHCESTHKRELSFKISLSVCEVCIEVCVCACVRYVQKCVCVFVCVCVRA